MPRRLHKSCFIDRKQISCFPFRLSSDWSRSTVLSGQDWSDLLLVTTHGPFYRKQALAGLTSQPLRGIGSVQMRGESQERVDVIVCEEGRVMMTVWRTVSRSRTVYPRVMSSPGRPASPGSFMIRYNLCWRTSKAGPGPVWMANFTQKLNQYFLFSSLGIPMTSIKTVKVQQSQPCGPDSLHPVERQVGPLSPVWWRCVGGLSGPAADDSVRSYWWWNRRQLLRPTQRSRSLVSGFLWLVIRQSSLLSCRPDSSNTC